MTVTTGRTPDVQGVLETCLYAPNLAETAAFYDHVIGLRPIASAPGRHMFFRCGRGVLLLFNPDRSIRGGGDVPPHGARGPGHIAFAVREGDLVGWRDLLRAKGVEIEAEMEWPGGARSMYVRDPAGNSVELANPGIWNTGGGSLA